MVTYEYKCNVCGMIVASKELQESLGEHSNNCGGILKRIFSAFSFVMK